MRILNPPVINQDMAILSKSFTKRSKQDNQIKAEALIEYDGISKSLCLEIWAVLRRLSAVKILQREASKTRKTKVGGLKAYYPYVKSLTAFSF